jgi:hypothetical protein
MPLSHCRVQFTDIDGIRHSVSVDAESLYEAVALAIGIAKTDELEPARIAPGTEFKVIVERKVVEHAVRLDRVKRWLEPSSTGGPAMMLKKERLRKMVEG